MFLWLFLRANRLGLFGVLGCFLLVDVLFLFLFVCGWRVGLLDFGAVICRWLAHLLFWRRFVFFLVLGTIDRRLTFCFELV